MIVLMRQLVRFVTSSWGEHMALQWITNIMLLVHAGLGVAVIAGGPNRFVKPTYQPLVTMVNGDTWLWGVWILSAAGLMAIPARWPQIIGLWCGMVWFIMWSSLFAISVIQYPTSGATPVVAYLGFAMIDTALLTARIIERDGR